MSLSPAERREWSTRGDNEALYQFTSGAPKHHPAPYGGYRGSFAVGRTSEPKKQNRRTGRIRDENEFCTTLFG